MKYCEKHDYVVGVEFDDCPFCIVEVNAEQVECLKERVAWAVRVMTEAVIERENQALEVMRLRE